MNELPISRPVSVAAVPPEGLEIEIVASEQERAALAALNEVVSVDRFEARLTLRPQGRDGFVAAGKLDAAATRACVVTLEPFVETLLEDIDVRFAPDGDDSPRAEESVEEPPDPIVGGVIDLGAVASEFFTLALDPYPRKPGAVFEKSEEGGDEASPFAALKGLRDRSEGAQ